MMKKPILLASTLLAALAMQSQTVIFSDDFETYTAGTGISAQSANWDTWDGSNGPDAMVSADFANSGVNSVKVQNTTTDCVLPIGPFNSGKYDVRWKMFIPTGSAGAYFNALHNWANNNTNYQWAVDVFFTNTGVVNVTSGAAAATNVATVPIGQWFDCQVTADMDADVGKVYLQGVVVAEWQWSLNNANGAAGLNQLAAVNFYGTNASNTNGLYYIDDVAVIESTGVSVSEREEISAPVWYPNPASEMLNLSLPSWSEGGTVRILDLTGRVLMELPVTAETLEQRVDLAPLTTGIYLVKVINGHNAFTGKVTVRK